MKPLPGQLDLFSQPTARQLYELPPTDPNVREHDKPRLTGQNAAILERLRQGPASNAELAQVALKYTSRLSDLRKAGYRIKEDNGVYTLL